MPKPVVDDEMRGRLLDALDEVLPPVVGLAVLGVIERELAAEAGPARWQKRSDGVEVALPDLIRVAAYVSHGRRFVDVEPYPDALARRALGALDDATLHTVLDLKETP